MTTTASAVDGKSVTRVPYESIVVVKQESSRLFHNPRLTFKQDALDTLRRSIAELGLIKSLLVTPVAGGKYELIAGERRYRSIGQLIKDKVACKDIDTGEVDSAHKIYKTVPVTVVRCSNDLERLKYAVHENLEAAAVPDWDILMLCLQMENDVDDKGQPKYTRDDLVKVFNRSQTWISHTLSLTKLSDSAKLRLQNGTLSRTAAIHLLSANPDKVDEVIAASQQIIRKEITRELARAEEEMDDQLLAAELSDEEARSMLEGSDFINAKMHERNANAARKKASVARTKIDSLKKKQKKGEITAEAVDIALNEVSGARKEDAARKARSPKFLRQICETYATLLAEQTGENVTHEVTGQHPRREVELAMLGVRWALGQGDGCLLETLKAYRDNNGKKSGKKPAKKK